MSKCKAQLQVERLLKQHKAELVRHKKHLVYRFPNGRIVTIATTPRGEHAWEHQLRDLRHTLGLVQEHQEGTRRARKLGKVAVKRQSKVTAANVKLNTLQEQLLKVTPVITDRETPQVETFHTPYHPSWLKSLLAWLKGLL